MKRQAKPLKVPRWLEIVFIIIIVVLLIREFGGITISFPVELRIIESTATPPTAP